MKKKATKPDLQQELIELIGAPTTGAVLPKDAFAVLWKMLELNKCKRLLVVFDRG